MFNLVNQKFFHTFYIIYFLLYFIYLLKLYFIFLQGIKFEEFEKFFLFLNNLEEFTSAIRLFALAEKPISQAEFLHAVKASTSNDLDSHIVELIYRIFDANNDNQLSFSEFIAIMNDRFHRGFTVFF